MVITEQDLRAQLEQALDSVLCFCGNHKRIGKPLCFQCFDSLPKDWQLAIAYGPTACLEHNQIHTYDSAREWLRKHYSERFLDLDSGQ